MRAFSAFVCLVAAALLSLPNAAGETLSPQDGTPYTPAPENLRAREEFSEGRFGIFIHWGIYSMIGRGEWVMQKENINYQEYPRIAGGFFPSRFDAGEWVRIFKASGAKYITFTSRHHDGFAMFSSRASSYNIVDSTPFGRDVVGELAKACSEEGLKLHLYYSHVDWGRTDYYPLGRTGHGTGRPQGKDGDWEHYLGFIDAQLTELLSSYGPIGAVWFDGVWDMDAYPRERQPAIWNLRHQYDLIHSLQPTCLVGNNHHLLPFEGEDIQIFERDVPGANEYGLSGQEISPLPLETCQTMNNSWGYRIGDTDYKSSEELIAYLAKTASKSANLLLNVGPRPDGSLPEEAVKRLLDIGEWLSANGESIYGTVGGPLSDENGWGVSTCKGNTLYIHQLSDCETIEASIEGLKLKSASFLDGGEEVPFTRKGSSFTLSLPSLPEGSADRVVKLVFNKDIPR